MSRKKAVPQTSISPGVPARPELPPTIHRLNEKGLIEVVDMNTGRILCVQTSYKDLLETKWDRLTRVDTPDGPVWLEKGLNFDDIKHMTTTPYSKLLADLICEFIVGGMTLVSATKELNLKYSAVIRWKREHKEFEEALLQAAKDRSDALHDEVLHVARTRAKPSDQIAALQWAAEQGNKEKFSQKAKIGAGGIGAIQIVLATGIVRPGDAGYVAPQEEERSVGPVLASVTEVQAEEIAEYTGEVDGD